MAQKEGNNILVKVAKLLRLSIYPVYNVFILRVLMYPKTRLRRIVQLTLMHRYNVGLSTVLRFSGVVSRMERCENVHFSFWR